MGTQLNDESAHLSAAEMMRDTEQDVTNTLHLNVPWLDAATAQVVAAIVATVAAENTALRAAILYGSVARHEERPVNDRVPSDVDLLLLLTPSHNNQDLPFQQHRAVFASVGEARARLPEPPREIQVLPTAFDLSDWDETFVENVARDGIVLWNVGELPALLATIANRTASPPSAMRATVS